MPPGPGLGVEVEEEPFLEVAQRYPQQETPQSQEEVEVEVQPSVEVAAEVQPLLFAVQHPVSVEEEKEWEVVVQWAREWPRGVACRSSLSDQPKPHLSLSQSPASSSQEEAPSSHA